MKDIERYNNFCQKTPVAIPVLQRDYVQGADKNANKRNRFFSSLLNALLSDEPFEMDFIYGSSDDLSEHSYFQPIDGQQRLTTLAMLAWVLNNRLNGKYSSQLPEITYLTRPSSEQFMKHLFAYRIEEDYTLISEHFKSVPGWFSRRWLDDPTINAILEGLDYMDFLLNDKKYSDRIDEMAFRFFTNSPLIFERLDMHALNLGDDLYIKMNARGKMLTPFENWKAGFEGMLMHNFSELTYEFSSIPSQTEEFPSLAEYFIYAVEHDWCNLLWPNAYKRWADLSENARKKVSYPRIDEDFMNILNFVSRILYFTNPKHNDFKRSSFDSDIDANREAIFSSAENVILLMRIFDTLVALSNREDGINGFFDSIFTKEFDPSGIKVNLYGVANINLVSLCLSDKLEINYEIILWATLKYLLSHPECIQNPDENLRDYLRIIVGWVRSIRQRQVNKLNVAPNLRLDNYPEAATIINQLSAGDNVFTALASTSESSLAAERRKARYVEDGKYDIVRILSGHRELYYCFNLLYNSIDECCDINLYIKRFNDFIAMDDITRIRTLLRYGYDGVQPLHNHFFYGLREHWDYIFTVDMDDPSFSRCLKAFTGYLTDDIQTEPAMDSFAHYLLNYDWFLNAYNEEYGKQPLHYFIRSNSSTFQTWAVKTMSTKPISGYNVDPYGYAITKMFSPTTNAVSLTDGSYFSEPGYLYLTNGKSDAMIAECCPNGWELSDFNRQFGCVKDFFNRYKLTTIENLSGQSDSLEADSTDQQSSPNANSSMQLIDSKGQFQFEGTTLLDLPNLDRIQTMILFLESFL